MNFNFYMPSRVIFGKGSLNNLHKQKLPGKKALIVTGGTSIKKFGYLKRLEEQLDKSNISHVLF
ncbi:iron-containing alcohol dehydrogenase, partial [Brachyspira catarrhinii]